MFSRRGILKMLGISAAAPAVVAEVLSAPAAAFPVEKVALDNYGFRMWVDWAGNAVPLSSYRNEIYREYIRENLFTPYIGPGR